jgi:hypothetical protein
MICILTGHKQTGSPAVERTEVVERNTKEKAEAVFGEPLEWQRLDDRRACRIRHRLPLGGLADRDRWPEIQEAMIDAMVRLEKALKPQVKRLRL